MMATTHALAGLLVGALAAFLFPEAGTAAVLAGIVGGAAPDLDIYAGHRKTLHYPVYGSLVAAGAVALAILVPIAATVVFATFLSAAALHAASDALGGGLELRPWEGESDRAVYDHARGRWLPPRRWIRYDGSPEDLGLASVLAIPGFLASDRTLDLTIATLLAVSLVWVGVRRVVPQITERVVALIPRSFRTHLPDRFVQG